MGVCYWCGIPPAQAREHVPPIGIFPKDKRKDLITVPSCAKHNQDLGKYDEKAKVILQMGSDTKEAFQEFTNKTFQSLNREEAVGFARGIFEKMGPSTYSGSISSEITDAGATLYPFFEKIVRGLYYHHNAAPFGGTCFSIYRQAKITSDKVSDFFRMTEGWFANPEYAKKSSSKNPEIFKYRYIDWSNANTNMFAVSMIFYGDIEVVSVLQKPLSALAI